MYKKELGFSTHRKKRMKKIKRDKARGTDNDDAAMDNFELFISGTDINWCFYKDSHRALGQTFGMLVLQDFETMTPNLLARTVETVEGGGMVVLLMRTVKSLKQLYNMTMDVHSRYRTAGSGEVVPRFNERFILTLGKCENCLVCDDELNILPISKKALAKLSKCEEGGVMTGEAGEVLAPKSTEDIELESLKASLEDTPNVGVIVNLAKTLDQARAILTFLEACSEKTNKSTVALTAGRGRGKSAAIGLCLAGAISFGYSNIFVTAPDPENLVAVFDFVMKGLKVLKYEEHHDYTVSYDTSNASNVNNANSKVVVSVEMHRDHRQIIKYVPPNEVDKFSNAELVAIDEAAAIPLPTVRKLIGNHLTFMSSTVSGYEGTGRALSLKLIKEMRERKVGDRARSAAEAGEGVKGSKNKKGEFKVHEQRWAAAAAAASAGGGEGSDSLREIELVQPIRYGVKDPIELWLNNLLCLDSNSSKNLKLNSGAPAPNSCELYSVDRDALFSYHKLSESFLQKMMCLYTSAHYKNSPNDLQMLSDAPAHKIFVLLSPAAEDDESGGLPDILAVVQIALEGQIQRKVVEAQLSRGQRASGDLIPWTIAQQFGDSSFAQLSGARIVRVAVHPQVQGMGYGTRAIELLYRFYNGDMINMGMEGDDSDSDDANDGENNEDDSDSDDSSDDDANDDDDKKSSLMREKLRPKKKLPPLLLPLSEVKAPKLDWIGTSFGLTQQLYKFWRRSGMRMLYLRQTANELTGEHSSIMVRTLPNRTNFDDSWLPAFVTDARRRFVSLLCGVFRTMEIRTAAALLEDVDVYTDKDSKNNIKAKERLGSGVGLITSKEIMYYMTHHDIKRLEQYGRNLCDHHLVTDLISAIARLYVMGRFGGKCILSSVQSALLCGVGLQNKTVDDMAAELKLPLNQVLAMFNKAIRKISMCVNEILEASEKEGIFGIDDEEKKETIARGLKTMGNEGEMGRLEEEEREGEEEAKIAMNKMLGGKIDGDLLKQFSVKGSEKDWENIGDVTSSSSIVIETKKKKPENTPDSQKRPLDFEGEEERINSGLSGKKLKTPKSGKREKKEKSSKKKKRKVESVNEQ